MKIEECNQHLKDNFDKKEDLKEQAEDRDNLSSKKNCYESYQKILKHIYQRLLKCPIWPYLVVKR